MSEIDEFDFTDLFVFDMANNHQGSVEHGLKIVEGICAVARKHGVRGAMKFQFRQLLDTFVHPSHKEASETKHIPRFQSTRLDRADYQVLVDAACEMGLLTMCTPFDEISTRDVAGDSYYRDKSINRMEISERKTNVDHWGRFQLPEVLGGIHAR